MPMVPGPPHHAGVVIPIRGFNSGKARLAEVLNHGAREDLATSMANAVVDAAGVLPVTIVSSSPEVRTWALTRGLELVDDPGTGLDGAVAAGRDALRNQGYVRVIIAHADLPRARAASLERFAVVAPSVVSIVPSHRDDGTPVLGIPSTADFGFAYGVGSAARHAEHARALGLDVDVVTDADLGFDVDLPEDLDS